MKKVIKKWGNSLVIRFSHDDVEINPEISEGNLIDFTINEITEVSNGK